MEAVGQGDRRLGGRYRLLRQLNPGGFGQTYLAEDTNRFQELCVLRECNPQVQGKEAINQAQRLFEREANLLYQLDHPQIPRFRELLREGDRLFLVQDYVEGPTYRDLLTRRQAQGGHFSEAEVIQVLAQLLPVLQYLHGLGIVHRDISPDNLVQRNTDGRPVLIDFGGVKQLLVNVRHQLGVPDPYHSLGGTMTRLGRVGYVPEHQYQTGQVSPSDDLYALGITALVLLTGQEPGDRYAPCPTPWVWPDHREVSDSLRTVLEQMVASDPAQRPTAAAQVMAALHLPNPYPTPMDQGHPMPVRMQPITPPPPEPPPVAEAPVRRPPLGQRPPDSSPYAPTATVAPASSPYDPQGYSTPTYTVLPPPRPPRQRGSGQVAGWLTLGLGALVMGMVTGLGWWLDPLGWRGQGESMVSSGQTPGANGDLSPEERTRKRMIRRRAADLAVDWKYLVSLTDQVFFERHPDLRGTSLTTQPQDVGLRAEWDDLAQANLDLIEAHLSPEARGKLGRYTPSDQEQWQRQVNGQHISSKALDNLTDARFQALFPRRTQQGFVETPVDQMWLALAQDRVTALTSGTALTEIRFEAGRFSHQVTGELAPGDGHIYLMNLSQGQRMRLNLEAPPDATRISLYVPVPTPDLPHLIASATDPTWAGALPQSGYYEIVVVSQAQDTTPFKLTVGVDNVSQEAAPPPPAKTP